MRVTKFNHACLFIEKGNDRLVIDPGAYTELPRELDNISLVVVTHEHGDHCDPDNLNKILEQSPEAKIYTTAEAGKILAEANIPHETVSGSQTVGRSFKVKLKAVDHAVVYGSSPCKALTVGVGSFLYYASDSYVSTRDKYTVVAAPTSGPWFKFSETIDFIRRTKSKYAIPTHNGFLNYLGHDSTNKLIVDKIDQEWIWIKEGESKDFS